MEKTLSVTLELTVDVIARSIKFIEGAKGAEVARSGYARFVLDKCLCGRDERGEWEQTERDATENAKAIQTVADAMESALREHAGLK